MIKEVSPILPDISSELAQRYPDFLSRVSTMLETAETEGIDIEIQISDVSSQQPWKYQDYRDIYGFVQHSDVYPNRPTEHGYFSLHKIGQGKEQKQVHIQYGNEKIAQEKYALDSHHLKVKVHHMWKTLGADESNVNWIGDMFMEFRTPESLQHDMMDTQVLTSGNDVWGTKQGILSDEQRIFRSKQRKIKRWEASRRKDALEPVVLRLFEHSALTNKKIPWIAEDLDRARFLLEAGVSLGNEYLRPSMVEDSEYCGLMLEALSETFFKKTGKRLFDPVEARVIGILHDMDKTVQPDDYLFANLAAEKVAESLGIRADVLDKLDPVVREVLIGKDVKTFQYLTFAQRLHRIADNFGKMRKGHLFTKQEFETYAAGQVGRYSGGEITVFEQQAAIDRIGGIERKPFATSRAALRELQFEGKMDRSLSITFQCVNWFEEMTGVSLETIQQEVMKKYTTSDSQTWVDRIQKTYFSSEVKMSKEVRDILQTPELEWYFFDAGNVLIDDPGDLLKEKISTELTSHYALNDEQQTRLHDFLFTKSVQISLDKIVAPMDKLFEETMRRAVSEDDLQTLCLAVGIELDDYMRSLQPFNFPELYNCVEGMPDIVDQVSVKGKGSLVLSDCSSFVIPAVSSQIQSYYEYFRVHPENLLFSGQIGAAKRDANTQAFLIALDHAGVVNPRTVLFIDDKPEYLEAAKNNLLRTFLSFKSAPELGAFLSSQGIDRE